MMTRRSLDRESRKAAAKAAKLKQEPLVAFVDGDIVIADIPNLGDYVPKGWELVEEYFVDSSGFGSTDAPALTVDQFKAKTKAGFGYAIIEEGQFQLYVGEFKKG